MKQLLVAIFCCIVLPKTCLGQYYLRGQLKDETGRSLTGVLIKLHSKGNLQFFSGDNGLFGIPSQKKIDTVTLSLDGYETLHKPTETQQYQTFVLKILPATARLLQNRLASTTKNLLPNQQLSLFGSLGESYSTLLENGFITAEKYSETGFVLNIDRASYSNIRRFLNNNLKVPTNAVRIEEMLNYFNFSFQNSDSQQVQFSSFSQITSCPWNSKSSLLFLNLNAPKLNVDSVPPSNLVFLIDVSGSMDKPNRLPLLQAGFKLLIKNLRAIDVISIVTYGGNVAIALPPTNGNEKSKINAVIDSLAANGDTPGEGAIHTAYTLAKSAFKNNGNNRIILATDGDFNVGQTSDQALEDMITIQRQSGIYLTCLGVGMGNYKDSKLETLAKKGNGNFAYLDNASEAEKVLVTEFTKTIYNVANDAYVNVEFDAKSVKKYRLIGYDNKKDAIEDSTSKIEGGEVGSGHSSLAIFEIELEDAAQIIDNEKIAIVKLTYQPARQDSSTTQIFPINYQPQQLYQANATLRFAAAVSMFGALLKNSTFAKNYTFNTVLELANTAADINSLIEQEFILLVQKAEKIYNIGRKKRE